MKFKNAMQLKAWVNNKSKKTGIPAPELMKIFMLERLLERISLSNYRDKLILKGGFLIASMIGVNLRSTADIDTTVKNIEMNRNSIINIMQEVITTDVDDGIVFVIQSVTEIHEESEYDDFRMMLLAKFEKVKEHVQVDFTTGYVIIPHEIEYQYKLMFEDRTISVMSYNLNTILSEKIEAILSRHIEGTRARDYYDIYMLVSLYKDTLCRKDVLNAIRIKAQERGTQKYIEEYSKYIHSISDSPEIAKVWQNYTKEHTYAEGIKLSDTISAITWLFEG